MFDELWKAGPTLLTILTFCLTLVCSGHVILYKRDPRSAIGWVGIIWLVPIVGSVLYLLFGINRVRRWASVMQKIEYQKPHDLNQITSEDELSKKFPDSPSLVPLARLGSNITGGRPLLKGNAITPLINGDQAFPRMLEAIRTAKKSLSLSTYIFDNDDVGRLFINELSLAVNRGVEVRVLIDDIGLRYSWRPVLKHLKHAGIPVARFMGALRPMTFPHLNLRKHRKILVADGLVAFTGGINIRNGHLLSMNPKHPVKDLHFEVRGELVNQLQEVFVEDWSFATKEILEGSDWFGKSKMEGETIARVISDGPDEDLFRLSMCIEGAIASAQDSVWILTPYFLPDLAMTRILYMAALKGVKVNILLPEKNNLAIVQWAANPQLLQLIHHGCRIWFTEPPFDHTKLILVDECWVLFGSANLDPRSLRLNFELNVECFDERLGEKLIEIIIKKLKNAHELTEEELRSKSLPSRLRDGVARLFSPYL